MSVTGEGLSVKRGGLKPNVTGTMSGTLALGIFDTVKGNGLSIAGPVTTVIAAAKKGSLPASAAVALIEGRVPTKLTGSRGKLVFLAAFIDCAVAALSVFRVGAAPGDL